MDYELFFSIVGVVAMLGWALLVLSPLIPKLSDMVAGYIIPVLLSFSYIVLLILSLSDSGGFGSFAKIAEMFTNEASLMAAWVHFLAFDLIIGAWMCRVGRREFIPFWMIVPCLPVTFLFGPAGYICFLGVHGLIKWKLKR